MAAKLTPIFEGSSFSLMFGESMHQEYFTMEGITPVLTQGELAAAPVLVAGLPPMFSAHVSIRGLYVSGYSGTPLSQTAGSTSRTNNRVCVHYGRPSLEHPLGGTIPELRGSNGEIILNRWPYGDLKGEPILVGWQDPSIRATVPVTFPDQIAPGFAAASLPQYGGTNPLGEYFDSVEVPTENPNILLSLTRTEQTTAIVGDFAYRRGINTTDWFGFQPNTVVCRDIIARKIFAAGLIPDHYVVSYLFEIAPDPSYWFRCEFFRDWQTGRPVVGIDVTDGTNNGYTFILPWTPVDFNSLLFTGF